MARLGWVNGRAGMVATLRLLGQGSWYQLLGLVVMQPC
jgi:hypothetical protein